MADLTRNEEDYLKALFYLIIERGNETTGTNMLAEHLDVTPASANSMLKKLRTKELVSYEKYGKLELTPAGEKVATSMVRRHRLWETFLQQYLNFSWDEVHDVAEELEHIRSEKLIAELDEFLGHPTRDPHGAVIPTASGEYNVPERTLMANIPAGTLCRIVSVKDSSQEFLQYLSRIGLELGSEFRIVEILAFDDSMTVEFDDKDVVVSNKFAERVYVEKLP